MLVFRAVAGGLPIFLVCGTLRPETMFGQTNCWIHPDIEYIAHKVNLEKAGGEQMFISTRRAAKNMSYQGFTTENGQVDILTPIKGQVNSSQYMRFHKQSQICLVHFHVNVDVPSKSSILCGSKSSMFVVVLNYVVGN